MGAGPWALHTHVAAPATTIAWRTELAQALAESKRSGKPVLVDFNAV